MFNLFSLSYSNKKNPRKSVGWKDDNIHHPFVRRGEAYFCDEKMKIAGSDRFFVMQTKVYARLSHKRPKERTDAKEKIERPRYWWVWYWGRLCASREQEYSRSRGARRTSSKCLIYFHCLTVTKKKRKSVGWKDDNIHHPFVRRGEAYFCDEKMKIAGSDRKY
jgi:cytochrome c2